MGVDGPKCATSNMSSIGEILRTEFSQIDDDIYQYIEGVLDGGDEFENTDDVYEAIGEVLHDVSSDKDEDEIKSLCHQLLLVMKPNIALKSNGTKSASDNVGGRKLLEAPVLLSNAATYMQEVEEETGPSIWNKPKGEELKVDSKKTHPS